MHGRAIEPGTRMMNDPSIVPISMKGRFASNLRGKWLSAHDKDSIMGKKRRDVGTRPSEDHFRPALSRESMDRLLAPRTLKLRNPIFAVHGNLVLASGPTGSWPLAETSIRPATAGARSRPASAFDGVPAEELWERRRLLGSQRDLLDSRCAEVARAVTARRNSRRARTRSQPERTASVGLKPTIVGLSKH